MHHIRLAVGEKDFVLSCCLYTRLGKFVTSFVNPLLDKATFLLK